MVRPSPFKVGHESLLFLQRVQGHICDLFRYLMILIDSSAWWSHVYLLYTYNIAFARLLAQIIRLNAQFLDYSIKIIHLNNTGEFTFKMFNDYCTSISIDVEHPIPHVHTQNS